MYLTDALQDSMPVQLTRCQCMQQHTSRAVLQHARSLVLGGRALLAPIPSISVDGTLSVLHTMTTLFVAFPPLGPLGVNAIWAHAWQSEEENKLAGEINLLATVRNLLYSRTLLLSGNEQSTAPEGQS